MPIAAVRQAVVFGNVQVSTQALEFLATLEVPVVYMTPYGRFVAALMPAPAKNTSLRADQYRVFADPARALALAKEVVRAKVANQRTLLMRSLRTRPAGDPGTTPEPSRGSDEPAARDMADLLARPRWRPRSAPGNGRSGRLALLRRVREDAALSAIL